MKPQTKRISTAPIVAPIRPAALIFPIPTHGLFEIGRDEGADDSQNCCQYETLRFVVARRDQLGYYARDKAEMMIVQIMCMGSVLSRWRV